MPRTPDFFPGDREEEGLLLLSGSETPSKNGEMRYVTGVGFRFFEESVEKGLGGVFGNYWQFASSEAASTTTSNSYQQKLRLTTPVLTSGSYVIWWSAIVFTASANKNFQARVQVDDITTLTEIQYRNAIANHDYTLSGFQQVALSASVHTIDIDWSSQVGSSTSIALARLALWQVG